MEKFDERKKSFEKKFAHDEELKFKVVSIKKLIIEILEEKS